MNVLNINSGIHAGGRTSPRKMKERKNDGRVKIFLLEGGLYKAVSEDWLV